MADPVRLLLETILAELRTQGAVLRAPAAAADIEALTTALGRPMPAGYAALLGTCDGGTLGGLQIHGCTAARELLATVEKDSGLRGLLPVVTRDGRAFALDAEGPSLDGEWPVVEVAGKAVDRAGTSFLRFLWVTLAEIVAGDTPDVAALAERRCRRDPAHGEHWLDWAEVSFHEGKADVGDRALDEGLTAAAPLGPALLAAWAMRRAALLDTDRAVRACEDAMALEPQNARDDDGRLDAAALLAVLRARAGDATGAAAARDVVGEAASATASFFRIAAVEGLAGNPSAIGLPPELALDIVAMLAPEDRDVARLRAAGPAVRAACETLVRAREALDGGRPDDAERATRNALRQMPEWALAHALLAESLNARHDRAALPSARRATDLNPALLDGWRELGDAEMEAGEPGPAEAAFRRTLAIDPGYGVGYARLAQVLLEQGRSAEALEAIGAAAERGGDPFFVAALRGDIYAEMERHADAASSYDEALHLDPEDHWALHQAAISFDRAGQPARAYQLYEAAIAHNPDGCHQTLVDYADCLRRAGRIGDAVRFYRQAVRSMPSEPGWRHLLKEAEKELSAAPN